MVAALVVISAGVVSCSDMPTAPLAKVTVLGALTDRDGAAVVHAYVYFEAPHTPSHSGDYYSAQTDGNGSFQVEMPEGIYEVSIDPGFRSGLPRATIPKFKVSRNGDGFQYRYTGTKVSGELTGPGGAALDGASVTAYSSSLNGGYISGFSVAGHYSILVPPGDYEIYAGSSAIDGLPRFEVEAAISSVDTVISFALTGRQVTVTTTLGGSTALAGAAVSVISDALGVRASTTTRVDGTGILYLPDGNYSYTVYPPDRAIVGPESGSWPISADAAIAVSFPATRWDITLRRSADNGVISLASVYVVESESHRDAGGVTDVLGRVPLIVRPNVPYDFQIQLQSSKTPKFFTIPNVSSTADSTFDLFVNAPVP